MKDHYKAIFLPVNDLILSNYKGLAANFKPLKPHEIRKIKRYEKYYRWFSQEKAHPCKIAFAIIFIPFVVVAVLPFALIDLTLIIFGVKNSAYIDKAFNFLSQFSPVFWPERYESKIEKKYNGQLVTENIPEMFQELQKLHVKVFLYSFDPLSKIQHQMILQRKNDKHITDSIHLTSYTDIRYLIEAENISVRNSQILVQNIDNINKLNDLGFSSETTKYNKRSIHLLSNDTPPHYFNEVLLHRQRSLNNVSSLMDYYLYARFNSFFKKNYILYIEDEYDVTINDYISHNIKQINERLAEKDFVLLYLPGILKQDLLLHPDVQSLLKSYLPALQNLSEIQQKYLLHQLSTSINIQDIYQSIHNELALPYYKRPCLLRLLPDENSFNQYRFTYAPISYSSITDLDHFFDFYINQVKLPDPNRKVFYQLKRKKKKETEVSEEAELPSIHFEKEDISELPIKKLIDELRENGEHDLMAQAIVYLFKKLNDDKPEIIASVFPAISNLYIKNKQVILSPLLVDNHYKIFLPAFDHAEVKMHALPKTLYLFYLLHPEGVRFKELFEYRNDLLTIYNQITNKYDKQQIELAIDDLVDMSNPSINQKSSRIREAFRNIMDEQTASYYYLQGKPGEPKKIMLPQNMITFIPDPFKKN